MYNGRQTYNEDNSSDFKRRGKWEALSYPRGERGVGGAGGNFLFKPLWVDLISQTNSLDSRIRLDKNLTGARREWKRSDSSGCEGKVPTSVSANLYFSNLILEGANLFLINLILE